MIYCEDFPLAGWIGRQVGKFAVLSQKKQKTGLAPEQRFASSLEMYSFRSAPSPCDTWGTPNLRAQSNRVQEMRAWATKRAGTSLNTPSMFPTRNLGLEPAVNRGMIIVGFTH